jgi:hypothetical protein
MSSKENCNPFCVILLSLYFIEEHDLFLTVLSKLAEHLALPNKNRRDPWGGGRNRVIYHLLTAHFFVGLLNGMG